MAAPSYTEDLTDIATGDEDPAVTAWTNFSTNDQGTPKGEDSDYPYIQGLYAVTQTCSKSKTLGNLGFDYGSTITLPTDGAFLVWHAFSSPFAIDDYAGTTTTYAGMMVLIGDDINNFDGWNVGGKDKTPMPYGGWQCHAVNTTISSDLQEGTKTIDRVVGAQVALTAYPSKGEVHQVDVMRFGRASSIFENGDLGNGYATFGGFAIQNDSQSNRWGLVQAVAGGYLWQGRMLLGTDTNAVDFRDSNQTIFIKWTPKVTYNFNTIEIKNIDSNVEMTGITFQVLDITTASPGRFVMSDPADVAIDQCTFVDMGEFIYDSTTDVNTVLVTNTAWRRCGKSTQNGATITDCSFINIDSTSSVEVNDLDLITNCTFISDGSNHGMELDSNHAGGSYTLDGCVFEDYASGDGSTGNECIYNNSGGSVTINVSNGAIPSIRNGAGASTTVIASVIWNFEIKNASNEIVSGSEFRIYNSGTQTQVFGVETSDGTETYPFDQSLSGNNVDVVVHTVDTYLYFRQTLARPAGNTTTTLVLAVDRWYSNEATTKTRTWGNRVVDDFKVTIDSYINSNNPTTPYGSDVDLKLASDIGEIDQTLFDPNITTIPIGATINTAKLYFYIHTNTYTSARDLTTYPLKRDWVESQVTWNVYSTGNSWQDPGALGVNDRGVADAPQTNVTAGQTGWVSMDVSDSLQDYYDETIPVFYGWVITFGGGGAGESLLIHSREYLTDKTLRPYLEVNYTT